MKDRRKIKKRKVLLALYLAVCLVIIVAAYFHLSRIARNFNTEHLELITGLYAEKMNDSMEYLQNYVQEDNKDDPVYGKCPTGGNPGTAGEKS